MSQRTTGTQEKKTNNPLAMYDFTIPCDKYHFADVTDFMGTYCKRWCFQQEKGFDTGYIHYQCRVSLISKKRYDTMIKWISELKPGWHTTPTANPSFYGGNEFYVMKEDTRIQGPWTDRTHVNTSTLPKRFRSEPEWRPWQKSVIDFINEEPDDRKVNIIYDPAGNSGKTFLTLYLTVHNKAQRIPQQKEARDILRMVMDAEKRTCYFIDLPRGISHANTNSTYSAIEEIKNGYCYDDRYQFKQCVFEPPHVWVFTNQIPPQKLLSKDRWKYWTINMDNQLIPYQTQGFNIPNYM